jgi:polyphosphate kinase 2 (PPK2 family)
MNIKNIYMALRDQMPFFRFIRNLRTGNVLGLFYKRSHYREDGKEKVMYNSKASAEKAAKKMMEKHGNYFSNYKCIYCNGYHLGKNRDNK